MLAAAVRELQEEVSVVASADAFSEPFGFGTVRFSFAGCTFIQDQAFFAVRVDDTPVSFDYLEPIEKRTTLGHGWRSADELESSDESYSAELPAMLRMAVQLRGHA